MKNTSTQDTKRMTKADIKKMNSKTNWAKLLSEDKKEKSIHTKTISR
jgi:hypothetical protein